MLIAGKAEAARRLPMAFVQRNAPEVVKNLPGGQVAPEWSLGDRVGPFLFAMPCCAVGLLPAGDAGVVAPRGCSSRDHLFRPTDCYGVCPSQRLWPKLKMYNPEMLREISGYLRLAFLAAPGDASCSCTRHRPLKVAHRHRRSRHCSALHVTRNHEGTKWRHLGYLG